MKEDEWHTIESYNPFVADESITVSRALIFDMTCMRNMTNEGSVTKERGS